jgi:hypothetical protein
LLQARAIRAQRHGIPFSETGDIGHAGTQLEIGVGNAEPGPVSASKSISASLTECSAQANVRTGQSGGVE